MIDKRKLFITAAVIASLLLILITLSTLFSFNTSSSNQSSNNTSEGINTSGTVAYTDSITGQKTTDFPDKAPEVTSRAPRVQLEGIDSIFTATNLSDQQAAYVQQEVTRYLAAQVGVATIQAELVGDQIDRNPDSLSFTFTVEAIKPQMKYLVTVTLSSQDFSANPSATFKQVE